MGAGGGARSQPEGAGEGLRTGEIRSDQAEIDGVKIVTDVDKKSFTTIADPYLDKLAKDLGPHAEKIKNLIRAIN